MSYRPACPDCGEPMVFLSIPIRGRVIDPQVVNCWVCDCQNDYVNDDIIEARMDASPDASLCLSDFPDVLPICNN